MFRSELIVLAASLTMLFLLMPFTAGVSGSDEKDELFPWQDGSAVLVGGYMGGFRNITEGVRAAKDGQSVYIAPGLYRENVLVNKSVRLVGLFDRYIGIDGRRGNFSIRVTADGASLEDIVVLNASSGIEVISCNDVKITGCKAFYCNIGLSLANCSGTVVDGCTFMMNGGAGMHLADTMDVRVNSTESSDNGYGFAMYYAPYTTFENCTARGNSKAGFHLYWLSFGTMVLNSYSDDNAIGVHVLDVDDVLIQGCHLSSNRESGIHIMSRDSTIEGCEVSNSDFEGVLVESSERLSITNNTIYGCRRGVVLRSSENITLSYNRIMSNMLGIGLVLGSSGNSMILNDIITGSSNVKAAYSCGTNLWSNNYWPDSDMTDKDGDGLFDGEYIIDGDPPSRDISPRSIPLIGFRAVSRVFWEGVPEVNRSLSFDGSNSWPQGGGTRYNWSATGCGLRRWGEGPTLNISPTSPGNLTVRLRVRTNSSVDVYFLTIPIVSEGKTVSGDGPGFGRQIFILMTITLSITVLLSLTVLRWLRRPLPPVPRSTRWP